VPGVTLGTGKPMRRRDFIGLLCGVVASRPLAASAQDSSKRPLIVTSVGSSRAAADRFFDGFSQGMRELGYVESRDYDFEVRYADGQYDLIPAQMDELVRLKPDIIVSGTMAGVVAAKKLTSTVPIVSGSLVDPIAVGVAASQARPGCATRVSIRSSSASSPTPSSSSAAGRVTDNRSARPN
jgi:putative ABC transport system substrate-binding protein